jgi:hypothetical protein
LLAGIVNRAAREGLRGTLYQSLAWGVPYLLGRLYFSGDESLLLAARAFVISGALYLPICLIEFFAAPQFYAHLYGYQPYRWVGAARYIGFRPIGFLEDGNQLGIWMATAALLSVYLWKHTTVRRLLALPIGWIALALVLITILCQSGGSIILLACALPFILLKRGYFQRQLVIVLIVGVLCFAGFRLTNLVSLRSVVNRSASAHAVADFMVRIGRQSFGWRLGQDERHVHDALAKPLLGSGRWNWWQGGDVRPWGLWLLAFGMYGAVGLFALETLQLAPIIRVARFPLARGNLSAIGPRQAFAAVLLITAVDSLLNSCVILPLLLATGGLSTPGYGVPKADTEPGTGPISGAKEDIP